MSLWIIRRCLAATALLAMLGAASSVVCPPDRELLESIRASLAKDCGTGDPANALATTRIRALGPAAIPPLWDALRHGPTDAERTVVTLSSRLAFAQMKRFIAGGGLDSVRQSDLQAAAAKLDERTYVSGEVGGFDIAYRERALNALTAVRPPGYRDSLKAILGEPTLPPEVRDRIRSALAGAGVGAVK